ncbi:ABC-2 type transport system permease protein [Lentibacillus halodurans]|uniref:ABC-2 type transport system permease protein n=1 Tax=Lentibacillus halodurans TaxID=237679 RepID=A0A1I0ZFA2_9BACI|nr:ABC transporter permease [Lentibacillus halodurans]SFB24479.1 ABC-2 type transport system permease protein [Lentibacillus halodurans]
MTFIKHSILFIRSNLKKLQRKWLSLPLLLLFPIILVSLIAFVAISIFTPHEQEPIHVGLVDLDQSPETEMVTEIIEESSQLGSFIKMESLTEAQAKTQIDDRLSAYVSFPKGFTESLYNGNSVTLSITGNPNKRTESYLVKELLDSIARHIRASQANILTINFYAKQMSLEPETRQDMLFQQFNNFLVYAVGKDKILDEEQISNNATSTPVHYYGLAAWFMIMTIWLLTFYLFFTNEEQKRMQDRMRLYGVKVLHQLTAKIITAFIFASMFAGILFYIYIALMDITLYGEDYVRIGIITVLYSLTYLFITAILEILFSGQKIRLLAQSIFTLVTLLASGAIVPTLYFPLYAQNLLPYFFASEGYHWLQEILLNGRLYADYVPMSLMLSSAILLMIGISLWKERAFQ